MENMGENAKNLEELSVFLSELNANKSSHIGYCGDDAEEIYHSLAEEFSLEKGNLKFVGARNSAGEIIAAIGIDTEGNTAEVWGPFNKTSSIKLQHRLWKQLLADNLEINVFRFFINMENKLQQRFMDEIGGEVTGEHLIMELKKQVFDKVNEFESNLFIENDFPQFERLHNEIFPSTYYDAGTIKERLGNGNILRVLKTEENEIQAYVYVEVDTNEAEASLEYIGVSEKHRSKGLGARILREAVTEMFSFPHVKTIKLVVENNNSPANHVYFKIGFEQQHSLISYNLKR